jgi:sialic acid synthase SpsE/mannose-6-phosphate isomerase-like protein (cupin superfamily)
MLNSPDNPLVILEFANNHMGDDELYREMVDDYAAVARDYPYFKFAIKLQYRDLDTFIHPDYKGGDHSGVQRFESTKVTVDEWSSRIDYAISKGFLVGCTPFDEVSVDEVLNDKRLAFLKIGSCSFNDWPFLEKIRKELSSRGQKTTVIASTGGMSLDTVDKVVSFLTKSSTIELALMHCVAEYPSKIENQNLSWVNVLSHRYQTPVGFSTHEDGEEESSGAYAFCLGASIFEKHVVSSSAKTVNAYSANPDQIRKWLDRIVEASKYVGEPKARVMNLEIENKYLNGFRRGVFARNKLDKGVLSYDDIYLAFPRVDGQLTANDLSNYINYDVQDSIDTDKPISFTTVESIDARSKIDEIRDFVSGILREAKIEVHSGTSIEVSHHYGLERYDEVGLSMITLVNLEYCKKIMIMKAGQYHPEQYHKVKRETFILLYGEIELSLDGASRRLKPGDIVTVDPGVVHSFTAIVDSVIEEISSTHASGDSYYVDDTISSNANRKSFVSLFE